MIRGSLVEQAVRGATLLPMDLLDIRSTLVRARTLHRLLTHGWATSFPHRRCGCSLRDARRSRSRRSRGCIDERGEVLDSASDVLARIRRTLRARTVR